LAYFETSARDAINIDEVFYAVASEAFNQTDQQPKKERAGSMRLVD
jgi:GTPase SAR1 family protein